MSIKDSWDSEDGATGCDMAAEMTAKNDRYRIENMETVIIIMPKNPGIGDSIQISIEGCPWVIFDPYSQNDKHSYRITELWYEILKELDLRNEQ